MALKTFRGTFRRVNGELVGLDFYADNRALALDHAACVAGDVHAVREFGGPLTLVKVRALDASDVYDAGSWYPMVT